MIDILIPLMHGGSRQDNFELKICLRSIEKNLTGYGNIFIVGEKPEWIKNIVHIPFEDSTDNKQRAWNIYRKILAGCNCNFMEDFYKKTIQLSDNFLYFNDDHYLLTDYIAGKFPYYHRGSINLEMFKGNNAQFQQMENTLHTSRFPYIDTLDFDVHCPILMNRNLFKFLFKDSFWPDYGYGIKSVYGNSVSDTVKLIECEDLKFSERIMMKESIYQALEGRSWFSIGDRALLEGSKMKEVLLELYNKPSKYEL